MVSDQKHSTYMAIDTIDIELVDTIVHAVEKNESTVGIFLIFRKLSIQLIMKFCCTNWNTMGSGVL